MIRILIVAAGESKRLGKSKQLLPLGNTTLLGNTVKQCLDAEVGPVTVILGAYADEIVEVVDLEDCQVGEFEDWKNGMGATIARGMRDIGVDYEDAVLIVVGDQPYLTAEVIQSIAAMHDAYPSNIVISRYNNGAGPPTLIPKRLFHELELLSGDEGARSIVLSDEYLIRYVSFPKGDIDIDTRYDLKHLL